MDIIVGTLLGVGTFLIWWSFWPQKLKNPSLRKFSRIFQLLLRAGIEKVSVFQFFLCCFFAGLLTLLLSFVLTASMPISLCLAGFGTWLPVSLVRRRARRRSKVLRELWPDVVDNMRSAVRAGLSISEALAQIGEHGPAELRRFFSDFSADYRVGGQFEPALERLKVRLADPVADRIIAALKLAREVGGTELGRLLATLSDFLRENLRVRSELEARQSWLVNSAKLAVLAPWLMLLILATQPRTILAYNSMAGWIVLAVGLLVSVACYRLMMRIGALPEDLRVLR